MISRYLFWATLISITFLSLKEISQEIVPGLPFIDKFIHFFVYLFLSLLLLKGYSKNFSPQFLTILLFISFKRNIEKIVVNIGAANEILTAVAKGRFLKAINMESKAINPAKHLLI